jgi:hypothetical protein
MASYEQVTRRNVRQIHETNTRQPGAFLLTKGPDPGRFFDPDVTLSLFRKATLDLEDKFGPSLEAGRNCEPNREYTLRPKKEPLPADAPRHAREWEQAGDFFEVLKVGNYCFQIHYLSVTSTGLFGNKYQALFIPRWSEQAFAEAMTDTLHDIADVINATAKKNKKLPTGLGPHEIKEIVAYVLDDIKTGRVLAHNIKAGENADAYLGM